MPGSHTQFNNSSIFQFFIFFRFFQFLTALLTSMVMSNLGFDGRSTSLTPAPFISSKNLAKRTDSRSVSVDFSIFGKNAKRQTLVYGYAQASRPSESDAGDHETPFDFNIIAYDWILGCGRKKTTFFS